eukprot:429764-Prorocentrum_minimum.AAC.1
MPLSGSEASLASALDRYFPSDPPLTRAITTNQLGLPRQSGVARAPSGRLALAKQRKFLTFSTHLLDLPAITFASATGSV